MYQVSTITPDGGREHRTFAERVQLVVYMGDQGSEYVRDNVNPRQRSELQDQPTFSKATGPMFNGEIDSGEAILRYEMDLRPQETVNTDASKAFLEGRTYTTRSIVNSDTVISITVKRRTAKTLVTSEGKTLRIGFYEGVEYVKPCGSYSMAPIVRAAR